MYNIYIHNIYNIYYMILLLIVLLFFCNHDNLILKLHRKKNCYLDERWLFIGSFKFGSVPGMIKKEGLPQFIYKPG